MMPTNEKELLAATRRAWKEIPQAHIDNHVRRFVTQCKKVVANKGV